MLRGAIEKLEATLSATLSVSSMAWDSLADDSIRSATPLKSILSGAARGLGYFVRFIKGVTCSNGFSGVWDTFTIVATNEVYRFLLLIDLASFDGSVSTYNGASCCRCRFVKETAYNVSIFSFAGLCVGASDSR